MSKYHSTVSRRDFMKALGLGAAGAAAIGAAAPVFSDIDELIANNNPAKKFRPWWIKNLDFNVTTSEIDWSIFKKWTPGEFSPPRDDAMTADFAERRVKFYDDALKNNIAGSTTRDRALYNSTSFTYGTGGSGYAWNGVTMAYNAGLAATDQYPKWDAGPDENFNTLRAFLLYVGVIDVGAIELDEKSQRLFNSTVNWSNTLDVGTNVTGQGVTLPDKCKYLIVWTTQQNYLQKTFELTKDPKTGKADFPQYVGRVSIARAYADVALSEYMCARFIQNLGGWQCYTPSVGAAINVPFGIFAGLGEQARANVLMTPRFGLAVRKTSFMITDMPLTPTPPIDFGGTVFCEKCKRCAEMCPSEAISLKDKRDWDITEGDRPGYVAWRMVWKNCIATGAPSACGACHGLCPFNHQSEALIHAAVRMTAAKTTIFNSFFGRMDRIMGYAEPKSEKELTNWWNRRFENYKGDCIMGGGRFNW